MAENEKTPQRRDLDISALKALAHPLRIEIYQMLGRLGSATASGLAGRLGESSGATSYHLRQLARHELVREIDDKGSGRERWWQVNPGGISLSTRSYEDEAGRASARMVSRQWDRTRAALLDELSDQQDALPQEWYDAISMNTANVSATAEQLTEIGRAWEVFEERWITPLRTQGAVEGAVRAQVHFNAFPLAESFRAGRGPAVGTPASETRANRNSDDSTANDTTTESTTDNSTIIQSIEGA
ncbi:helix-turn-helix transcriptional regulator [Frondihabitans sp. VKM Ac-2883]|uniref:ArsR/SmtB family transcription factor n=1 Tax=Frondihabitans sp. VKM Ac-2883 TaxID=2783823 RepID=UPI00188D72B5|nr:helix-turn-helix domain-containing protein [Frondihabitans sp. VKM Ac-2883]MBF4576713.1 helix-turn-helix transcriptional regulator [Frondihabitans sp. VKM Ac-2883]